MKKIFVIFFSFCLIIFPGCLKAEIKYENLEEALKSENIEPLFDDYKENDKQAIIYFFRGKNDEKSKQFLSYLNSIYSEYGKYFKLRSYEITENEDNSLLMANVIDYISANVFDAPFIVIGDVHFVTYSEDVNENIIKAITMTYESEEKTDSIEEVLVRYYRNYDMMIFIVIILIVLFIGLMVYASRKEKK
jgi:hypothetical protein